MFRDGKRYRTDHFQCIALAGTGNGVRFAAAVASSAGKAHDRNRIKRQLREAYRCNKQIVTERMKTEGRSLDLVFLWNSRRKIPAGGMNYDALEREVVTLLSGLAAPAR
jgi:ribonuclease P protein component